MVLSTSLNAQKVYQIDTLYPVHDINDFFEITADTNDVFTATQILNDSTIDFQSRKAFPRFLDDRTVYWSKIKIQTNGNLKDWTLLFEDPLYKSPAWIRSNGKIDVYAFLDKELLFHRKSGSTYPKSVRDISEKWLMNRINFDIPKNKIVSVAIRVEGNNFGFFPFFNATIRSPQQQYYLPQHEFNSYFNIFIFGVTFIIFLYHLLQFIYLRQRIFLWFSLWVGICMVTSGMSTGIDTELILGNFPNVKFPLWIALASSIFFTFWFFGRSFINSKEKFPKLDKYIIALIIFIIGGVIVTIVQILLGYEVRWTNVGFHYQLIFLYNFFGLLLAGLLILKEDRFARYFGLGALVGTSFFMAGSLWAMGLLSLSFDPYSWGMFAQIIIFSFGIAYRQQWLARKSQVEKLEAQKAISEIERIKDLDEIKTRFFANISHEFRTPLSLILGPLQHAQKNNLNHQKPNDDIMLSSKVFSILKNNAQRLQSLVDELLDLSKVESGHMHLNLKQGGLIKFLRTIIFSFESRAERKSISLNTSFPKEIDTAFFDKSKLEKIIFNLLSNAFKYTSEGGAVTLTVHHDEKHLVVEISDTGPGIEKNELKRIFERFYRVEGSEEKGSGIGLALTKELVDLHQGQISVSSVMGQGTTFKVRMPFTLQDLPKDISMVSLQIAQPILNEIPEKKKIEKKEVSILNGTHKLKELPVVLLIEDNADLRDFISDILQTKYKVFTAVDGLQGERMAFEHIPDLVISDVMMPKMDGYELCHSLKINQKTSHIPIIMLTAKAGMSNKMEGLTQGADVYLTKPFDQDELLLHMRNLIEGRRNLWKHFKSMDLSIMQDLDMTSADDKFLQSVIQCIRENLDNELLSVEDLARAIGFSRSQLHRKLKALIDKSANQLIIEIRLNEAFRMLENNVGSVSEVAYSVGYSNMSYFTKSFKEKFGLLPSKV